jgi:signal transduction histidine kinase
LLANAVAATPAGREVEVRLSASGGRAQVVVDDEGYGIPPARRAHLFERFSGDGRAPGSGTGLGLYIVRRIVEHHGGEVRYAPRDTGSTFTIDLPLRTGAAA